MKNKLAKLGIPKQDKELMILDEFFELPDQHTSINIYFILIVTIENTEIPSERLASEGICIL